MKAVFLKSVSAMSFMRKPFFSLVNLHVVHFCHYRLIINVCLTGMNCDQNLVHLALAV